MIMQDWIIPTILAAVMLDAGAIWAARIRRAEAIARAAGQDQTGPRSAFQNLDRKVKMGGPLIFGGAAALASTRLLNPMLIPEARWTSAPFFAVGGLLILSGVYTFAPGLTLRLSIAPLTELSQWLGLTSAGLLTIGASVALATLAAIGANYGITPDSHKVAAVCWGLGIVLLVPGASRAEGAGFRPSSRLVLGLSALAALAFLLRGTATSFIPRVLSSDESLFGLASLAFLQGKVESMFVSGPHLFPTLFLYIQAIPILLLGHTAQAIRILSALVGTLTVGAVYLLGRSMFGPRTGLLAAVFLAFSHLHIQFSRLALNNIWDGLWYVLVLESLWHAWKTGRRTSYLLAGLVLGLAQYFFLYDLAPTPGPGPALAPSSLRTGSQPSGAVDLGFDAHVSGLRHCGPPFGVVLRQEPGHFHGPCASKGSDRSLA